MQFPEELEAVVNEFARPLTRPNWRDGSDIVRAIKNDFWWDDYLTDFNSFDSDLLDCSWVEWCKNKMIIGPPRVLTDWELDNLDQEYLTDSDIERHIIPWRRTWCKVQEENEF